MEYKAHLSEDGRVQTVEEHLQNVGSLCAAFADAFGAEKQGKLIGMAHDIGKCSAAFQERLQGGRIVDHASAGALECAKMEALWASCCIAGHHGGMPDVGNMMNDSEDDPTLCGRLRKAVGGGIPAYEMPFRLPAVQNPAGYGNNYLADSFVIRMLYSCLVDADYLDTENFMKNGFISRDKGESLTILLDRLNHYIAPWWNPKESLNQKRCDVLKACMEKGVLPKGIYTLTVPTGGGKTVASMAFALNHAVSHGMNRVIYVIPYTSIIEQTAQVFRNIFGERNVVEHHSGAGYEIEENGTEMQSVRAAATENWDAPIIITTAVQFFESIYSNKPSKCRKLHNTANSVIVFDEAQTIPSEHLRPCVAAMAETAVLFGSTVVLCTATQPLLKDLFKEFYPNFTATELCPDRDSFFQQLRRVTYRNAGVLNEESLGRELSALPQVLCIVNSRKAARSLYSRVPKEGSYHLSTLMVPAHRKKALEEIRQRLKEGKECRVISTSLIEAGVDVDFPAVYRELSGLDSILQAAGRCNREGKRTAEESVVTVFEGISVPPRILRINIGAAREVLKPESDPGDPEMIRKYFDAYRSLLSTSKLDKANVISAFNEGIQGRLLPFRTVAERFHLIDEDTKTVYIPFQEGSEYINRMKTGDQSRALYRRLSQFGVNIYENYFQILMNKGVLELLDNDNAVLLDKSLYSFETGLDIDREESAGFFI